MCTSGFAGGLQESTSGHACAPSTITGQAISLARDNYFLRGHKRLYNTTVRIPRAVLMCIYIVQCSNQGRHA